MNTRNIAIIMCVLLLAFSACEEYEEYIKDYDFSAVYFGTQQPLRTIVAYDEMNFKVGVALAGKRENNQEEWVNFEIEPELLADNNIVGANNFILLPQEYYSLSNSEMMVIPEGEFIGDVTVTLNKAAFTSDPLAHLNTYALPLRLKETSVDSVLRGKFDEEGNELTLSKDYTVLVVKYISPLHGTYYHKGIERELNSNGIVLDETVYNDKDLSKNDTWDLQTLGLDAVLTSGAGTRNTQDNKNYSLRITRNADNTVAIEETPGSNITLLEGEGTYNEDEREFYLDYKFSEGGTTYSVTDTLILRQPPEMDLRFEEWNK